MCVTEVVALGDSTDSNCVVLLNQPMVPVTDCSILSQTGLFLVSRSQSWQKPFYKRFKKQCDIWTEILNITA